MKLYWIKRFFIGALLLIILHIFVSPRRLAETIVSTVAAPFLRLQYIITHKITDWRSSRQSYYQMSKLIRQLQEQNKTLLQEIIALHGQLWFSQAAEELILFKKRYYPTDALLGHVILKTFNDHEHSYIINKGSYHGVKEDMVAVWHNCLIGRVTSVLPLQSKVTLITDSSCKIGAHCLKSNAQGILQGIHNLTTLTLSYVDHLAPVNIDDTVMSSGQGTVFPQGFFLGTIIYYQAEQLYHYIMVKPLCDFTQIEYCYLLLKGMYDNEADEKLAL